MEWMEGWKEEFESRWVDQSSRIENIDSVKSDNMDLVRMTIWIWFMDALID